MTFSKILVAYDFSEPAARALDFACSLARKLSAQLDVVHVHPEIYDGRGDTALGLPWPTPDQADRYVRFLEQELKRAIQTVDPEALPSARCHVLRGEPARRVLALAEELGSGLVCVGSTGKGGVERLLLGSLSQAVLRASPVPVLVVH